MFIKYIVVFFFTCILAGCSTKFDEFNLKKSSFDNLAGWNDDYHSESLTAFKNSCLALRGEHKLKWSDEVSSSELPILPNPAVISRLCRNAALIPNADDSTAKDFFEQSFTPYLVHYNNDHTGRFTGYYVPILKGSKVKTDEFQWAVYAMPEELSDTTKAKKYSKYYSRKRIDDGALDGKNLEIIWLNDKIMRFFMHIQGSAIVSLSRGEIVKLAYAGKNGLPYTAIGKVLIEKGLMTIEGMSMPALRQWLYDNPKQADEIMQQNESYIFFKQETDNINVKGGAGVELTPERSLAIDTSFLPYNLPIYLVTSIPKFDSPDIIENWQKLMIIQDTGSAIKGGVRGDIFFGYGEEAEQQAGYMNFTGYYYLLIPSF